MCLIGDSSNPGSCQPVPLLWLAPTHAAASSGARSCDAAAPSCGISEVPICPAYPCGRGLPFVTYAPVSMETLAFSPLGFQCVQEPAETQAQLSRGARRRLQQRSRKKQGKLERARLASEALSTTPSGSDESQEVIENFDDALFHADVQEVKVEVPTIMDIIDASWGLDILVGVEGRSTKKMEVPVCEIQQDVRLEEDSGVEFADVMVNLPGLSRQQKVAPQKLAPAEAPPEVPMASFRFICEESNAERMPLLEQAKECETMCSDAFCVQVANTFIHFSEGPYKATVHRRSRSS
mmetsp:Transcript_18180/g.41047  ORF Transcript_18180/g.41047 Transcript_18180/m.41047 type:complete len:294 (-) Transcript_18180:163-1044(-)